MLLEIFPEKGYSSIDLAREHDRSVNESFDAWLTSAHVTTCQKYAEPNVIFDHVPPFIELEALEQISQPSHHPALVQAIIRNVQDHGMLAIAQLGLEPVLLGQFLKQGIFTLDHLELAVAGRRSMIEAYRQELRNFCAGSDGSDQ
jgi:hypothetical protein